MNSLLLSLCTCREACRDLVGANQLASPLVWAPYSLSGGHEFVSPPGFDLVPLLKVEDPGIRSSLHTSLCYQNKFAGNPVKFRSSSGMLKRSRLPITGHSPSVSLYPPPKRTHPCTWDRDQGEDYSRQRNNSKLSLCHAQSWANVPILSSDFIG